MQSLYLDDSGTAVANAESDVTTSSPKVQIESVEASSPKTLNVEKGETAVETGGPENTAPNTPSDEGVDLSTKIVEEALNSLADSIPSDNVVSDAPTSLAQAQHVADTVENQEEDPDNVMADQDLNLEKYANVAEDTDKIVSSEEDLVVLKSVYVSGKKSGKAGIGRRLRERKGKEIEVAVEAPKSEKKKIVGPTRRSNRVEIPTQQKKQDSKRKLISLSDSDYDVEEDVPNITSSSKKKTPKKKKT
jgi:hypothetical protein